MLHLAVGRAVHDGASNARGSTSVQVLRWWPPPMMANLHQHVALTAWMGFCWRRVYLGFSALRVLAAPG